MIHIPFDSYKWHGEPVTVKFGYFMPQTVKEKPLFWYNFEADTAPETPIPAVRVTTKSNESFVISNHCGIGVKKLMGGGWPDQQSFHVPKEWFVPDDGERFTIVEFDGAMLAVQENRRRAWQERMHPDEFRQMEALRAIIIPPSS